MGRWRSRVRLEAGLKLDLNRLFRDGLAKRGEVRRAVISWHRGSFDDIVAAGPIEADFRQEPFGWITVKLGKLEQRLQCSGEWRNFGGIQWYFICPGVGARASVLWLIPGADRFLSRQAWGRRVAYGSQFETPRDRAQSQAEKIRRRLGGAQYLAHAVPDPPKPKGMHWRTYGAQLERFEAYEIKCNLYFLASAERLHARLRNR
jgi:hypothetical protein